MHIQGDQANAQWDRPTDLDIDHLRLKYASVLTGAIWESAADLLPTISATATSVTVPALLGTYMIKAVSTAGVESLHAAIAVSNTASLTGFNAIAAISDWPSWSGEQINTYSGAGYLSLANADRIGDFLHMSDISSLHYGLTGVVSNGTYNFANTFDLGAVYTSRVSTTMNASGNNLTDLLYAWTSLRSQITLDGADKSQWSIQLQLRTAQGDPLASPVWSDWQNFVVGDFTARAFQFRLLLHSYDPRVTPEVGDITVNIDMPDRVDSLRNVAVPSAGLPVNFYPPFRDTPAIGITGQNMATGDYFAYTVAPSPSGFTIRFYNAAGIPIARTIDWIADGYGYAN